MTKPEAQPGERLAGLQAKLETAGLNGLLVTKVENQQYLAGYGSADSMLLVTPRAAFIMVDFREIEAAGGLAPIFEAVQTSREYTTWQFIDETVVGRLAVEETAFKLADYRELEKALSAAGTEKAAAGERIVAGDHFLSDLRMIKDEGELLAIRQAQKLTDQCFSYLLDWLKPGLTEKQIALEIELYLLRAGAERLSFDTIAVSGANSSLPHGRPSDRTIEKGDFLTLDFGCVVDGYCSDMTRTLGIGSVSEKQKEIYDLVLKAQLAGLDGLKAGLTGREADALCRSIISAAGYADNFGHGTGHGVGLEIHEAPALNPAEKELLQSGMVVTVEPGIYLPGEFGVRIEDLAIVGESSIINLTKSDKDLIVI
ncbi:MAG TPA: aminopeptidase P family protein [Clostridiales bacterium]|nr:aminopeptidase P family protein [Clostridiales bacterium]